jgi:hypothetical protein
MAKPLPLRGGVGVGAVISPDKPHPSFPSPEGEGSY